MKTVVDVMSMTKKNSVSFMIAVVLTGAIILVSNTLTLKYI